MIDQDEALSPSTSGQKDEPSGDLPKLDVRRRRRPVARMLLERGILGLTARVVSLLILDFAGVLASLLTAMIVKLALLDQFSLHEVWRETHPWITFAYLVTVLMFARVDLYGERARRPGLARIASALFQTTIISLVFALASGQHFSSYYIFYGSLIFGVIYLAGFRHVYTRITGHLLARAGYRRRALLVGSGDHIDAVAHALGGSTGRSQISLVGFIALVPRPENGLRSLGRFDQLRGVLSQEQIDDVIIADPDFPPSSAVELVDLCHQRGVSVHVVPSTMEILTDRAEFVPGVPVPLFTLRPPVFEGVEFAVKRSFDLVLASALLFLLSPGLIAIAIAIRLSSHGPTIYRSSRPGMAGRPFDCLKFRTMFDDAEEAQVALEALNELSGALFKIRDDPRVTSLGRVLRRFSIDELPQLWNVLRGEMSLVGPRPLPLRDFERLEDWHKKRYLVLPGITGLWQVSGRSDLEFDDLVRLDFLYLEQWSIFLDLSILLRTIPAVFSRRGAF